MRCVLVLPDEAIGGTDRYVCGRTNKSLDENGGAIFIAGSGGALAGIWEDRDVRGTRRAAAPSSRFSRPKALELQFAGAFKARAGNWEATRHAARMIMQTAQASD